MRLVLKSLPKLLPLVVVIGCTTVEYGVGKLNLESVPKKGTSDPVNHSIDILDHANKGMELVDIRMLDKTGLWCAAGASLGSARAAQDKALRESPTAPVVTYQYRVYGSDEVGGSHCGIIYRKATSNKFKISGDTTAKGDLTGDAELVEYGFNVRNGYEYGNFAWGVEFAALFGSYDIPRYAINYFDPVSSTYFDRTAKLEKRYAVVPLEVYALYSPEFLYGFGVFGNFGLNLGTYTDLKYSYGAQYSVGFENWLLQLSLKAGKYSAKILGEKALVDESLALVGLSYLFAQSE